MVETAKAVKTTTAKSKKLRPLVKTSPPSVSPIIFYLFCLLDLPPEPEYQYHVYPLWKETNSLSGDTPSEVDLPTFVGCFWNYTMIDLLLYM